MGNNIESFVSLFKSFDSLAKRVENAFKQLHKEDGFLFAASIETLRFNNPFTYFFLYSVDGNSNSSLLILFYE